MTPDLKSMPARLRRRRAFARDRREAWLLSTLIEQVESRLSGSYNPEILPWLMGKTMKRLAAVRRQ